MTDNSSLCFTLTLSQGFPRSGYWRFSRPSARQTRSAKLTASRARPEIECSGNLASRPTTFAKLDQPLLQDDKRAVLNWLGHCQRAEKVAKNICNRVKQFPNGACAQLDRMRQHRASVLDFLDLQTLPQWLHWGRSTRCYLESESRAQPSFRWIPR